MQYTAYAIYNRSRNKIYIGQTADLEKRLLRHNGVLTKKRKSFTALQSGQWDLIYAEHFGERGEAVRREKELKSFRGREFVRGFIRP